MNMNHGGCFIKDSCSLSFCVLLFKFGHSEISWYPGKNKYIHSREMANLFKIYKY
jgi:diphthamide synthase subunit DPH2